MWETSKHARRVREHLSHPLIPSVSHSGSTPLPPAPPFDPCLMRVLDHQYSNYITWKRGKTFLSLPVSTMQPKCIINAKLPDALPLLSFLLVADTHLKIFLQFTSDVVCTYSLSNYYYFFPTGLFALRAILQGCA